jgi:hypothetical protein
MDNYVGSIGGMKKFDTSKSLHPLSINISAEWFLDRLLCFIKTIVEYALGIHIGYATGWLIGLWIGHTYVKHFEPVYFDDLSQLSYWILAPDIFAKKGAMIGIAIGVIAIVIVNNKLLNQRITSLYKNGCTHPNNIARLLGKSAGQIERKINKLIEKGKIL